MGEYQALAKTNIIDPYDDESDDVNDEDAIVEKFEEVEEMTMLIHGLHRRAGLQGGENQANKRICPQEEGQGLGVSVKSKRRRRLRPDPYANVPFVVWEIMQWAHTFLSIKFVYYAVALDEPAESAYAFVFCLLYSLCILDRFKNPDGLGIGTLTNSYFIFRMTKGLARFSLFVAAALMLDIPYAFWTVHVASLVFVSGFAIQAARESALLYYGAIILWEFVLLPLVCYVKTVNTGFAQNSYMLSDNHMMWGALLFLAVCVHPFDPYTLGWREKLHLLDRRLRVPYDPIFY